MKIKGILSLGLILLVLLSSAIGFSQNDFESTVIHKGDITQLVEDSDDAQQEFREGFKVSVSTSIKSRSDNSFYDASQLIFQSTHHTQYDSYYQKHITTKPSARMFIRLGALII